MDDGDLRAYMNLINYNRKNRSFWDLIWCCSCFMLEPGVFSAVVDGPILLFF
jgi:hypothetical protein